MKSFDQRYFDKWYRAPAHRVRTGASLRRHAALALAVAEQVLERPVRRVLDIGCGEGEWYSALRALRPRMSYEGIDPSEYAVRRFGARRNVHLGSFGGIGELDAVEQFDLIVCVDVMHYVPDDEIVRGLHALGKRLHGVALLHAFTRGDDIEGDVRGMYRRPVDWYRREFKRAGLHQLGLGCWVGAPLAGVLSELESP